MGLGPVAPRTGRVLVCSSRWLVADDLHCVLVCSSRWLVADGLPSWLLDGGQICLARPSSWVACWPTVGRPDGWLACRLVEGRAGCGPAVERGTQFGCGRAGGGAVCPFYSSLSFCSGLVVARCTQFGHSLADGGASCASMGVLASHHHGWVWEWLRMAWRRPTHACWCTPPTVTGESKNGSARCGSDR